MAEGTRAIRGQIPFEVTDPERIPSKRYYDEEFYRLECEKLWPHVWQMACRLEQIPDVGDWVEYSNLGKSVIVVRTSDGVKKPPKWEPFRVGSIWRISSGVTGRRSRPPSVSSLLTCAAFSKLSLSR